MRNPSIDGPFGSELEALFAADQREREHHAVFGTSAYQQLRARDARRRARVREILAAGGVQTPEDHYHAAMILQHGDEIDEIRQAHLLAKQAAERGYRPARWLAAASLDRWLMYQGKPQKFGTQIVPDGLTHRLWDVQPQTTDTERAEWDVPPLAEMQARAAEVAKSEPMPPMEQAPDWLRRAIRRWYPNAEVRQATS